MERKFSNRRRRTKELVIVAMKSSANRLITLSGIDYK